MNRNDLVHKMAQRPKQLYGRYHKYLPVASFFGGFTWDSLTLRRIDQLLDNFILLAYLLLLGVFIMMVNLVEKERVTQPWLLKYREWYPEIIQFLLGSLFSAYVIFYFQSASLSKTSIFFAVLLILMIANEFLKDRLTNIYLQLSLFFFTSFAFFTFALPVFLRKMNVWLFLSAGVCSLLLVGLLLFLLHRWQGINNISVLQRSCILLCVLYAGMNIAYFLNWIPPVPLSLKFAGIYHTVKHVGNDYQVSYEKPAWYHFWKKSDRTFHYQTGDTVFCYAAIFAPTRLQKRIYQEWHWYSEKEGEYQSRSRIGYFVLGGRDGGYRGYTFKRNIEPGKWRVDIETEDNRLLGRVRFKIEILSDSVIVPLKTIVR